MATIFYTNSTLKAFEIHAESDSYVFSILVDFQTKTQKRFINWHEVTQFTKTKNTKKLEEFFEKYQVCILDAIDFKNSGNNSVYNVLYSDLKKSLEIFINGDCEN